MKTFKNLSRKLAIITLTLLFVASCGSDENEVTATDVSTSTVISNDAYFSSDWASVKSATSCYGSTARATDRYYYISGTSTSLTSGSQSGSSSGTWYGTNANGHTVAVQKVISSDVTYYNVVISACIINATVNGTAVTVLGDDDVLTNLSFGNIQKAYSESYGLSCTHDFLAYGTFVFTSPKLTALNSNGSTSLVFGTAYNSAKCY